VSTGSTALPLDSVSVAAVVEDAANVVEPHPPLYDGVPNVPNTKPGMYTASWSPMSSGAFNANSKDTTDCELVTGEPSINSLCVIKVVGATISDDTETAVGERSGSRFANVMATVRDALFAV
jgi:hypothetical protein